MQSPKKEGRSGYWGRDEEALSGAEGKSGTRRSVRNWKIVHDATAIWQRVWRRSGLISSILSQINGGGSRRNYDLRVGTADDKTRKTSEGLTVSLDWL